MSNSQLSPQSQQKIDAFRQNSPAEFVEVYDILADPDGDAGDLKNKLSDIDSKPAGPDHHALAEVLDIELSDVIANDKNDLAQLKIFQSDPDLKQVFEIVASGPEGPAFANTAKFIQDHKQSPVSDPTQAFIDELKTLSNADYNSGAGILNAMVNAIDKIRQTNNPNPFASPSP